jgi:hypothetical protein
MNKHEIACLALKIVAIYALVLLFSQIPVTVWLLNSDQFEEASGASGSARYVSTLFPLIILSVIVLLLLGLNRTIAWLLVDNDKYAPDEPAINRVPKQTIAFAIIGIYLIATTLPALISMLLSLLFAGQGFRAPTWETSWPELLSQVLTVGLGLTLFFRGGSVTHYWERLQVLSRPMKKE